MGLFSACWIGMSESYVVLKADRSTIEVIPMGSVQPRPSNVSRLSVGGRFGVKFRMNVITSALRAQS
jgi:hypothetical protein